MSTEARAGTAGRQRGAAAVGELLRFAIVGVLNTAFGYAVFWVGLKLLGLSPQLANMLGYAVSLCLAYVLTRKFVFAPTSGQRAAWRFIVAFAVAFALNQAVLWLLLHAAGWRAELAQLGAMISYTIIFFLLNKFFVFRAAPPAGQHP